MIWDIIAPVLGIGCFLLWLCYAFHMLAVNRNGRKKPGYFVVEPETAVSPDEPVTVGHFADQVTADLHRVRLESEGIAGAVFGNSYSKGQPRFVLRVRTGDAAHAVDILNRELRDSGE